MDQKLQWAPAACLYKGAAAGYEGIQKVESDIKTIIAGPALCWGSANCGSPR